MKITNAEIREFALAKIYPTDRANFTDTTPLFSEGLLDSFHLLELISFIENRLETKISPLEISLQNLDTIEKIKLFIDNRALREQL